MPGRDEIVVRFGEADSLVGIVTPASDRAGSTAVVLLNAGVIHRVGPHRMNVRLARHLAARGFTAMRFDLSGIGDSRAALGDLSFRERSVVETRAAIDLLAREHGASRFVLFGLCSGADNGLATALVDPRVVGLAMVDPFTYVTKRALARKLVTKAKNLGGVRQTLAWGLSVAQRTVRAKLAQPAPTEEPTQYGRVAPRADEFLGWLRQLLDRGVGIFAMYSGALGERYNDEDQLFEVFPELRGRVDRAWFSSANHTFTAEAEMMRLIERTTDWVVGRFAVP
jgi:dienelactone hydrolase